MSQFTKIAIMQTFAALLNEKPLDKITVTDIVNRCGVNRNTFYYYYQDIFALVDELFQEETNKILQGAPITYATWQEAFLSATRFAMENKKAIYHLYHSVRREQLEIYLFDVIRTNMDAFLAQQAAGLAVSQEDKQLISDFYTTALVGIVNKWLSNDMKEDPMAYINKLGRLLEGNIQDSLKRSASQAN